ncbi:MAG: nuclear transport factor 2 family protein [Caldilineaceae bacterium]
MVDISQIPSHLFRFRRFRLQLTLLLLLAAGLSGCISEEPPKSAVGSCTLSLPATTSDEESIQAVLRAEGDLVVKQQIDPLMALWAEDSTVVDAKNTPQDEKDDQIWQGKDAIRHRYVRVVFPGAPTSITPHDMQVTIDGNNATVQSTTEIGQEESKAGDRWNLVKQDSCWLIQRLTYNLEVNGG